MTSSAAPRYPFENPSALEPPAEWARLRAGCPVSRVRMASGDETLLLTRYDDVRALLSDPRFTRELDADGAARVSTAEDGGVFNRPSRTPGPDAGSAEVPAIMGGPGHARWRRLVGRAFSAKRVAALRPRIVEIADRLVDDLVAAGAPADLTAALGFPLPVFVICELLGVPADDRDRFAYWSDTMLNLTRYEQAEIDAAGAEFFGYMASHVRAERAEPGEDLLSELAAAVDEEDGTGAPALSETELVMTGIGLLVAGHETTANMIGKMVAMLLAERGRWERLLADPALVRGAVEEALRFDANPGFGMPRYVTEDVEIAGCPVARGTTVVSSMASANRDERRFDRAEEMHLDRSPNPHLAFGVGPHACIGQALARAELQTVLSVLLRRLPGLELAVGAGELRRREGLIVGGLEGVPVRW